jgi:hypothetical protein
MTYFHVYHGSQASVVLTTLSRFTSISGFNNTEPLHILSTYTSKSWLSTMHEDQMLDLLCTDTLRKGLNVEILGMYFFQKLQDGYRLQATGTYKESKTFTPAWSIGKALEAGERSAMGMMVNIHSDHWIAVAIDFQASTVWYGDRFGYDPAEEVTSVLDWCVRGHRR